MTVLGFVHGGQSRNLKEVRECAMRPSRLRFINLGTVDILDRLILCCGDCAVPCNMFRRIHGLYSLDVRNILSLLTTKNVSR